jgi:hypothetical protein
LINHEENYFALYPFGHFGLVPDTFLIVLPFVQVIDNLAEPTVFSNCLDSSSNELYSFFALKTVSALGDLFW